MPSTRKSAVRGGINPSNIEQRFKPETANAIYGVRQVLPSLTHSIEKGNRVKKICTRCGYSTKRINDLSHCTDSFGCRWRLRHPNADSQEPNENVRRKYWAKKLGLEF